VDPLRDAPSDAALELVVGVPAGRSLTSGGHDLDNYVLAMPFRLSTGSQLAPLAGAPPTYVPTHHRADSGASCPSFSLRLDYGSIESTSA